MTAAGQSFRHLASLGHERIGLVLGPEDHMPSRRKLAGFEDHARRSGISAAPVEHALFSLEGGQAATTRMLRQGVTGVICASDVLALGAIRAVRRAGLTVPGDVSVVGYDDSGWLNCTDPPLTTVRQPIESMGKSAVALLVSQMETTVGPRRGAPVRARAGRPRLNRPRPGPSLTTRLRGGDANHLDVDSVGPQHPGHMGEGDLRERVQGVDAEFSPVLHEDREYDLLRLVVGRQGPPLAKPPDLFGELPAHLMRAVEEGLGGDEALGEQVAERRGSLGALDVDQFVVGPSRSQISTLLREGPSGSRTRLFLSRHRYPVRTHGTLAL